MVKRSDLMSVLVSREISAVSFWDPIGPWPLLVNEISLDKFRCLVRVIRELVSGVWDVLFSSATLRKKSSITKCNTFHLSQTPPPHFQHLDKHPCSIPSPTLFNRVPSQHVWPHMQWAEHRAFKHSCIHSELSQNSKSWANWGISGKQVSSHFILYKSKPTPGLGLRTMPLEWDAFHLSAQCKRNGHITVWRAACAHMHLNRVCLRLHLWCGSKK